MRGLLFCIAFTLGSLLAASLVASYAIAQDPFKPSAPTVDVVASDSAFLADPGTKSLGEFRKHLLATAEQSCKSGEITRGELFKLRMATLSPKVLTKMHQAVAEQVVSDGKVANAKSIDWSKVIDIIKELLPVILQIIALFQ